MITTSTVGQLIEELANYPVHARLTHPLEVEAGCSPFVECKILEGSDSSTTSQLKELTDEVDSLEKERSRVYDLLFAFDQERETAEETIEKIKLVLEF